MTAHSPAGTLSIGTLRSAVVVSRDHAHAERVGGDVIDAIGSHLADAVRTRLPSALDRDEAVWLIRQLAIDADINAAWDADGVAASVASALVRSLARELSGTGDGVNTLRFPNRAALLARFLVDRVEGAGEQWYYSRFAGLRLLPLAAALRTALLRDAATGLAALKGLDPARDRPMVIDALSASEAARVLDALARLPAAGSLASCLQRVVSQSSPDRTAPAAPATLALALFVAASDGSHGGEPLRAAADLVSRAIVAVRALDEEARQRVTRALANGDTATLAATARDLASAAAPLDEESRRGLADAIAVIGTAARAPVVETERQWTRFGGAFLLLPDVDALPPLDFAREDPDRRAAALVTLGLCLSPSLPEAVLADATLVALFELPSAQSAFAFWDSASPDERDLLSAAADSALVAFSARLLGFAASGPDYLRRNFLNVTASLEREPTRIVVRVGRPPLHVMLSVAGLVRRRYELSWLDVPIEVFPEE